MSALSRLSPRERGLLGIGGAVLLVAGLVQFLWLPLAETARAHRADIAAYKLIQQAARQADAPQVQATRDSAPRAPAANRVTRSADSANLSLTRIEPDGQRLSVVLADAGYDTLVTWLAELQAREGLGVVSAEIDRRIEPGRVSARLVLEDM